MTDKKNTSWLSVAFHAVAWGDNFRFVRSTWFRNIVGVLIFFVFLNSSTASPASFELDVIRARISDWGEAWQNRDIDAYMSFYSPSFHSEGLDYLGWGMKKTEIFKTSENISVKISDVSVFIEGSRAVARFVQQYGQSSYTDVGEKVLILEKANSTWKIVSEEWTPLKNFGRKRKAPAVTRNSDNIKRRSLEISRPSQDKMISTHPVPPVAVENIDFEIREQGERVFINLKNFFVPSVFNLEGERPRIVIDIMNIHIWTGKPKIPVNGRLIKQIRTYLHRETDKLRIVLDLEPSENYFVTQTYYKKENIYCIQVNRNP